MTWPAVAYAAALTAAVLYLHARRAACQWEQRRATADRHRTDGRWF